ncbi:MAG TPA: hypothetical protein VG797_00630 [Phycisphaerales bacterium]|nr:hypothetical protein [Phycisphaerales bacterium]
MDKLKATRAGAAAAKDAVIKAMLEEEANEILSCEFMLDALQNELEMYVALKRDSSGAAWAHLVNAQMAAIHAVKAHPVAAHLEDVYIPRLHLLERLLFPKQLFMSMGLIVERAECSLCGAVYGDCEHIKGRPYMGHMCVCVITKSKLLEASFVECPANKHCRVLSLTDENGIAIDVLSLEPIELTESSGFEEEVAAEPSLDERNPIG